MCSEPQGRVGKHVDEVKGTWGLELGDTGCVPIYHNLSGGFISSSVVQNMISSQSNSLSFCRIRGVNIGKNAFVNCKALQRVNAKSLRSIELRHTL